MKIELSRDWTEFLSALIYRRVRFVLVGGHAVSGHAEPRLTEDLDVFVERSAANARRLREALIDFGFGNVVPAVAELARPHKVFMLGHKPWRIDILHGLRECHRLVQGHRACRVLGGAHAATDRRAEASA